MDYTPVSVFCARRSRTNSFRCLELLLKLCSCRASAFATTALLKMPPPLQISTNLLQNTQRAVNVNVTREMVRATVDSVKGEVRNRVCLLVVRTCHSRISSRPVAWLLLMMLLVFSEKVCPSFKPSNMFGSVTLLTYWQEIPNKEMRCKWF